MNILVIGGTGTVGRRAVRGLLALGQTVRVYSRSAEKLKALPKGVQGAIGGLGDAAALGAALKGMDHLLLITPLSRSETEEGVAVVRAAVSAGIRHVVFQSIHHVEQAPHIPHFNSKIEIEAALKDSEIPYTVIMPNHFFQNDEVLRHPIVEEGIYPVPIGNVGLSRVDVRDIAEAEVNALVEPGHEGKRYPLAGPEVLTGEDVAEIYGRVLGRPVRYGGNDLEAWGRQMESLLPDWLIRDLTSMFEFFQDRGLRASKAEPAVQGEILHHPPRRFESFAAEQRAAWKEAPGGEPGA